MYFDTCFFTYNVQVVTALWLNRELSFLNLASVILTILPKYTFEISDIPRVQWLLPVLL